MKFPMSPGLRPTGIQKTVALNYLGPDKITDTIRPMPMSCVSSAMKVDPHRYIIGKIG